MERKGMVRKSVWVRREMNIDDVGYLKLGNSVSISHSIGLVCNVIV